jgi:hypothetical protein
MMLRPSEEITTRLSYAGELKLLKVPGSSSHLRSIGIDYGFFSDDTQSSEHRFSANQDAVIDLSGQALDLGAGADFLRTELPENPFQGLRLYRLGAEPSIQSSYWRSGVHDRRESRCLWPKK